MRLKKQDRQQRLVEKIEETPFITDETLANIFQVSIQTIRLDRLALGIPELRKRIRSVADDQWNETVKSLPLEDVIGDVIDLELDQKAISIMTIQKEQVFTRNEIARGHNIFEVSIQTIRLDRLALGIPELRKRIRSVADDQWNETVKSLPLEDVIGDVIDLELDQKAISIMTIQKEQVFTRNEIARGHHLF